MPHAPSFQTHTAANFHAIEGIGKTAGTTRLLTDGFHQPRQGRRAACQQNMVDAVVGSAREEELQRTRHFLGQALHKGLEHTCRIVVWQFTAALLGFCFLRREAILACDQLRQLRAAKA